MADRQSPNPPFPKFPEQDENGVDLSLIRSNLRLSVTERIRRADEYVRGMEEMRKRMSPSTQGIFERLKKQW